MLPRNSSEYTPVKNSEDLEDVPDSSSLLHKGRFRINGSKRDLFSKAWPWLVHCVLLSTSLLMLYLGPIYGEMDCACENRKEIYSPLWNLVEYETRQFNGTLDFPSEFRGNPLPSPEVDAAWDALIGAHGGGIISIPGEVLSKLNKSDISVQLPENLGGGYMANVEVFHQLHCLDVLRKWTYKEYYKNDLIFVDSEKTQITHKNHCIEILRQKLICDADIGVITYNWVKDRTRPYPDFSTKHQCRRLDKIQEWTAKHQIHASHELVKPPGAAEIPNLP